MAIISEVIWLLLPAMSGIDLFIVDIRRLFFFVFFFKYKRINQSIYVHIATCAGQRKFSDVRNGKRFYIFLLQPILADSVQNDK